MSKDEFKNIPKEMIWEIALNLDIGQIGKLCKTSATFYHYMCMNDDFWRMKVKKDFNIKKSKLTWRETYQDHILDIKDYISKKKKFSTLDKWKLIACSKYDCRCNYTGFILEHSNTVKSCLLEAISYDIYHNLVLVYNHKSGRYKLFQLGEESVKNKYPIDQIPTRFFINY